MLYHLPVLSSVDFGLVRTPGPGLGNLLFPISRALIGCERLGGKFVYPTMRQIKIGTILRREKDLRTYGDVFRGRDINEWRDWLTCRWIKRTCEDQPLPRDGVVTYSGLGQYFHDLVDHRELLAHWIEKNIQHVDAIKEPYDIGIHVRLGDFQTADTDQNGHSVRQTFEWYRLAYDAALKHLGGKNIRTVLFTDEDAVKVADELNIPNVEIDPSGNAATAILNLSRARFIITSRSTFSSWAAFLGNSAAIWHKSYDTSPYWKWREGLDVAL